MTPQIMAILNVTPDSFSDGGVLQDVDQVLRAAEEALTYGASILDIGGESTRPGAGMVPESEELSRVIPAIAALHREFPQAVLSIDTRKSAVARAAVEAGASMINDVSGLQFDPAMATVAAQSGVKLILMHSQGTPDTMQQNPHYINVAQEVSDFLKQQAEKAMDAGVLAENIILDPGFGFGKTIEHNLNLLRHLDQFVALGYPVAVGLSRKSFLTLGDATITPDARDYLSAAAHTVAVQAGVQILRLHNVKAQAPVIRLAWQILACH